MREKIIHMIVAVFLMTCLFGMTVCAKDGVNLSSGKNITYQYTKTGEEIYHKFVIPKNGMITVTAQMMHSNLLSKDKVSGITVSLYNSRKVALVSQAYYYANNTYKKQYVLKAGTYYLGTPDVHSTGLTYKYGYTLGYSFQAISEKSGIKKAKSVNVKRNKTVTGIVAVGETTTKADWYKIKLPKAQKLKLYFKAAGDASVTFTLYGPSYKRGTCVTLKNETKTPYSLNVLFGNAVTIKKGTYYLKVTKASYSRSTNSAYYSLKWK